MIAKLRALVLVTGFVMTGVFGGAARQHAFEQGNAGYEPPKYEILRQDEDWSVLAKREPSQPGDFFDPIKFIPLNGSGSVWLNFGGQARGRVEAWNNFNFGAPETADDNDVFLLSRFLYHADLHVGEYLRLFAQGKSAFVTGRNLVGGRLFTLADELDLQNGFVDLGLPLPRIGKWTLRVGRQEMLFGKQRLVSPADWSNVRRTFDGLRGIFEHGDWSVSGFWTRLVIPRKYEFNRSDANADFFGIYAAGRVPKTPLGVDIYWLGLTTDLPLFPGAEGKERRQTLGVRLYGKIPRTLVDVEVEGAYQLGEIGEADIGAFMFTIVTGYTFASFSWRPYLYIGFDYASGDDEEGDDQIKTFNKLFPTGHGHLGYIDIVGRQNIIDLRSGVSFKPVRKLIAAVDWHNFWRADRRDALYSPGGVPLRPGSAGSSEYIGSEIDLTLQYPLDRHILVQAGYSHFFAGDFIKESGPSDDVDFAYLMTQLTF
jgi:hypothetical protein